MMHSLQYWHEQLAQWRPCGVYSQDREVVVQRLLGHRAMTHDSVRFRIESTSESLTLAG